MLIKLQKIWSLTINLLMLKTQYSISFNLLEYSDINVLWPLINKKNI